MSLEGLKSQKNFLVVREFNKIKEELIQKHKELGMESSGKWINTLTVQENELSIKLLGQKYTEQLVWGRRPGTLPPVKEIEKWIIAKGIQSNIPVRSLAWAIAVKIKNSGTSYYKQGGTDLVSSVVTPEKIQSIINLVGEELTMLIIPIFINNLK